MSAPVIPGIQMIEKAQSPIIDDDPAGSTVEQKYFIRSNVDNQDLIYAYISNQMPYVYGVDDYGEWLVLRRIHLENIGGGCFNATVSYGRQDGKVMDGQGDPKDPANPSPEQTNDTDHLADEWSFDMQGGTAHITQSLQTISQTPAPGVVIPATKQAIGLTKDRVEGCDIIAPKFEFSRTMKCGFITLRYLRALCGLVGFTNENVYLGFQIRELLYLGCAGQFRGKEGWALTHRFAAGQNQKNVSVSPDITVAVKSAWDYLWVGYVDNLDAGANIVLRRPSYASVEQVYYEKDFFSVLGWR